MARYASRPKQRWCSDLGEEVADLHAPIVFEPFDPAQPTGLLDAAGNELYRIEEMQQVGFIAGMQPTKRRKS